MFSTSYILNHVPTISAITKGEKIKKASQVICLIYAVATQVRRVLNEKSLQGKVKTEEAQRTRKIKSKIKAYGPPRVIIKSQSLSLLIYHQTKNC